VVFVTEQGKPPQCDRRMLEGITQRLLGASQSVVQKYKAMSESDEFKHPLRWSEPGFTLLDFDMVVLPGGHDKPMRQIIDSERVHQLLVEFFPSTLKPGRKTIGAICHGVQVLAFAKGADGKSIIHQCDTTSLTTPQERFIYWSTRAFLGDYYKTYGAGSPNVEDYVSVGTFSIRE
jgi:putative intracellular protease/amidase